MLRPASFTECTGAYAGGCQGLNPTVAPFAGYQTNGPRSGAEARRRAGVAGRIRFRAKWPRRSAAQVAIALARSMAIEASTRIEAAREGERLRTALIDSLTHELRTPLTSIRAAATTLLEGEGLDEAGRRDMVRVIDEEAARLDQLIGEAVEMAEIDANVVQVKMSSSIRAHCSTRPLRSRARFWPPTR